MAHIFFEDYLECTCQPCWPNPRLFDADLIRNA